jgi:hypothetical protein
MLHFVCIVVTKDKEKRFIQGGYYKIQIIQGQITGRKYQINVGKTLLYTG